MGAWSVSITGNDTAQDLKYEYSPAFYYYDIPEALHKIDNYVRSQGFNESDEEEWCNYIYSLADFMWKKGILTEELKQEVLNMIDTNFGLEHWAESGIKTLNARKKALEKFRTQLLSEQPTKKKIKPNVNLNPIFDDGDLIAIKLQTAEKTYTENDERPMSNEEFHSFDGKYILIQKVYNHCSWSSSIVPEVKDYWAVFRLFEGTYDDVPYDIDIKTLKDAKIHNPNISSLFLCESSMFYFKKRNYKILGNYKEEILPYLDIQPISIFLGINRPWINPDSFFIASMWKEPICKEYVGSLDTLKEICRLANIYGAYDYKLSNEENEQNRRTEEETIYASIDNTFSSGGTFYEISFGRIIGMLSVLDNKITNFYIKGRFQNLGFGTTLLEYVISNSDASLSIDIPKNNRSIEAIKHICNKVCLPINLV